MNSTVSWPKYGIENYYQQNSIGIQPILILLYNSNVENYGKCYNNFSRKRPMERKNWTEYQDQILKYLKEERKIKRWTDIAKIMNVEYKIGGRNGKQCR